MADNREYRNGSSGSAFGSWIAGLTIGALGGITLALLTTPKSGREVRGQIKEQAKHIPGQVNNLLDDSLDLYAQALNFCQLVLEEQTLRVKRAVAAGKLAAAKKREELETGAGAAMPFGHR
jgi:gas vesicle protein